MMNLNTTISLLILCCCVVVMFCRPIHGADSSLIPIPDDSIAAMSAAIQALGCSTASADGKTDYLVSATRSVMVDSTTAFLNEQLDGMQVWIVHIPDVTFQGSGSVNPKWEATRDFCIYIDATTGLPIKAVARAHDYDESNWSKPPADSAARYLQMVGHEYHGTPPEAPKVSLLTAMTVISHPLFLTKEIVAKYVLFSSPSHVPGPVWDVYIWGIRFGTQPGPRYLTDFGRWTIDAVNGTPLSCGNMPHQIPRESDR